MCAVPPSARPYCAGVPRRAAPPRSGAAAGSRALGTNKPRGAAHPARGVTMPRDSSACRTDTGGFCATKRKIVNGVQVEVEVIPVGLEKKPVDPAPGHLRGGALARGPSACLAAVEVASSVPTQKRTKRTRSTAEAEAEVLTAAGDPALDRLHKRMASELESLRELLKKAELISRGPARKGGAAQTVEPQKDAGGKTPSAKRTKISPLPEQEQKQSKAPPRMSADERKQLAGRMASLATVPSQIVEFLQERLGGDGDEVEIDFHSAEDSVLFELQAQLDKLADEERPSADAVVPKEEQDSVAMEVDSKAQSTESNLAADEIRSDPVPEQDEGDVDICDVSDSDSDSSSSSSSSDSGGSSSSSDSDGSSSSSDSDGSSSSSDSGSESHSDEEVDGPAPPVVLPEENGATAQPPPEPAPAAAQSTKPEIVSGGGVGCTAPPALLPEAPQPPSHRASEVAQSAEPKKKVQDAPRAAPKAVCITGAIYRAKTRRQLLEMERAVVPDESIHNRDLRRLRIAEYGRHGIMRQLGLFLKADDA